MLPLGSMMNIARALGIPRDIDAAARLLVDGQRRRIDVGEAHGVYFLESALIGLTADLFEVAAQLEEHEVGDAMRTMARVRRSHPVELSLTIDGQPISTHGMMLTIANAPYTGIAYSLDPQALLNDGVMTLIVYRHFTKWELIRYLASTAFGRERQHPRVTGWPGRSFTVASSAPLLVRVDDFDVGTTPVEVQVVPNALQVMTGTTPFLPPEPLRTRRRHWARPRRPESASAGRRRAVAHRTLKRIRAGSRRGLAILWDPRLVVVIQHLFGPRWLRQFEAITELGSTWGVVVALTLAFWITGRQLAYKVLGLVAIGSVVSTLIKLLTRLKRPSHAHLTVWRFEPSDSFPSGHTLNATTLWGGMSSYGHLPRGAAVPAIIGVGLSRMYLGVHFLGDVIGGIALGAGLSHLYRAVWPVVQRSVSRIPLSWLTATGLAIPVATLPLVRKYRDGWQIVGALVGAAVALPVEYRWLRYAPRGSGLWLDLLKALVGLSVLVPVMRRGAKETMRSPRHAAPWFAFGAIWSILLAPAVFILIGLGRRAARP
jgi:membrane-associated phospholipid phosphatase